MVVSLAVAPQTVLVMAVVLIVFAPVLMMKVLMTVVGLRTMKCCHPLCYNFHPLLVF
jgi:hypothetical protein